MLRPLWQLSSLPCGSSRGIKLAAIMRAPSANKGNGGVHKFSPEGRQRIQELSVNGIGLYNEAKAVRRLDRATIHVRIAPRHTIQRFDMDYFTSFGRAYTEAVCRRYLDDNDKPLWWITRLADGSNPIVRNKGSARMNVTFTEALRNAGYDRYGRRVVGSGGVPAQSRGKGNEREGIVQLFGTVEVTAFDSKALLKLPFKELQSYFTKVVKGLEEEMGRKAGDGLAAPNPAQNQAQPARGGSNRPNPRASPERPSPSRQPDQPQRAGPQRAGLQARRNYGPPGGKPPLTGGGVRRLDLRRPDSPNR